MAYIYNNVVTYDSYPNCSSFLPYCNAQVVIEQPQYFQEIYYAPEPPPQIQVIRQRLPEPQPDVIERVVVVPQPKQYVYQVVEVPTKPPPIIKQRVVHQSPNPPLCGGTYRVSVPPTSNPGTPRLVQSSSSIQPSSSFVQQVPYSYSSAPVMTI